MSITGYAPSGAIVVNGSTLINGRGGSVVEVVVDGVKIVDVGDDCATSGAEFVPHPTVNEAKLTIAQTVQSIRCPTFVGASGALPIRELSRRFRGRSTQVQLNSK